jgi:hypothetical protein
VPHLASLLQLGEGAHGVLIRNAWVGHVHLVQVDVIEAKAAKALVALLLDVAGLPEWRQRRLARRDLPWPEAGLSPDYQVAGVRVQRLGEDLLRLAISVDVGGVDEVDAPFVGAAVDLDGLGPVAHSRRVPCTGDPHRTIA